MNQGHKKGTVLSQALGCYHNHDPKSSIFSQWCLLSSWSPFQESESVEEPAIHQHVSSPLFKKFGVVFQDSAEETTLVRPLHSNLKAAD